MRRVKYLILKIKIYSNFIVTNKCLNKKTFNIKLYLKKQTQKQKR